MYNPVSTYRIQFNNEFTLADLDACIPYFKALGVKTIYASPIFKAVTGSMHGYDTTDPCTINPEIGTEDQLRQVIKKLKAEHIGWVQDIVPNHMAFHYENLWLMDVLEKGRSSVYAPFFDTAQSTDFYKSGLMIPFLGATLEETIQSKELKIAHREKKIGFILNDQFYPASPRTYNMVFDSEEAQSMSSVKQWLRQLKNIHKVTDPVEYSLRWHELILQFEALMQELETSTYVLKNIEAINHNPSQLQQAAALQAYRFCDWKETFDHINYRRFFTVNDLICLNMQSEKVFDQYHIVIKEFVQEGLFAGVRVDHIDGLLDPRQYVDRLRACLGEEAYIVAEKILMPGEKLDLQWQVQGTTGYDFLSQVNNLFTRSSSENKFSQLYKSFTRDNQPVEEKIRNKKAFMLFTYMKGELKNLHQFLHEQKLLREEDSIPDELIKEAIAGIMIHCPVYRLYGNEFPLQKNERDTFEEILNSTARHKPELKQAVELLKKILLERPSEDARYAAKAASFYQRCMQFTGPLMAKGVEDTLMYTFNRFLAHNEVGDSPGFFGLDPDDFHELMLERQQNWPFTMNATSTHDTKRGEDVRMRLNVLTDFTNEWGELVKQWMEENRIHKIKNIPDENDEYFIYQTLIGSYPVEVQDDFQARLEKYFTKALREGKRNTDWTDPDQEYENLVKKFIASLLNPNYDFLESFLPFQKKISDFGMINSLAQLMLKFTCPGIPDTYQGTTGWDYSLVDPDNRRIIDYDTAATHLKEITDADPGDLWNSRYDGKIKLWFSHLLFQVRKTCSDIFRGEYMPLKVTGKNSNNILAFARTHAGLWIITVVPMSFARIATLEENDIACDWSGTFLHLPEAAPLQFENLLLKESGKHTGQIELKSVIKKLPFVLLRLYEPENERSAGILLAISSLPSPFGIGDIGKEARRFADFLAGCRQRIWQLLPLNIVSKEAAYSPYSSRSAFACNPLLVSPEELCSMNLLDPEKVERLEAWNTDKVNYPKAEKIKTSLLEKAWKNFRKTKPADLEHNFHEFLERESYWIHDFALFEWITSQTGKPWTEWPDDLQLRDPASLERLSKENEEELLKLKWIQFIFLYQWKKLKTYCSDRNISLLGDIPFYVSHNSADVWAHPEFFSLNKEGGLASVAGVPPDYFNDEGQRWGMPVFCWDVLKDNRYEWWIQRLRRNLELFDSVRLDHFRAFVDYWEIPAGEKNAVNGAWKQGPGADFFETVKKELGSLPFVAEDLGDINPDVFALRDQLELPGMKILQYAFDDDMAQSIYSTHNYSNNFIAYTGTHDNNTTRGWYRKDITDEHRSRLNTYFNTHITEKNIAEYMIRLAYGSVAKTAIIPLQDVLNLNEKSRMNTPSVPDNNWLWRLKDSPPSEATRMLLQLTRIFNR